jgi:hypothetical protein
LLIGKRAIPEVGQNIGESGEGIFESWQRGEIREIIFRSSFSALNDPANLPEGSSPADRFGVKFAEYRKKPPQLVPLF